MATTDAPAGHSSCWRVRELLRESSSSARSRQSSDRLIDLAAGLEFPLGGTGLLTLLYEGDGMGGVTLSVHSDSTHHDIPGHLLWVGEDVAEFEPDREHDALPALEGVSVIHELIPTVHASTASDLLGLSSWPTSETLADTPTDPRADSAPAPLWPMPTDADGMDLVRALTMVRAQVRVHLTPAVELQRLQLNSMTRASQQSKDPLLMSQYVGSPVCVRLFAAQVGDHLSPRLRSALQRLGVGLTFTQHRLGEGDAQGAWDGHRATLAGAVLPFGAAQCFVRLPAAGPEPELCGIPTAVAPAPQVPLSLEDAEGLQDAVGGLRLGMANDSKGYAVEVRMSPADVLLHTQILGATGSGKSTLLAAMAREAMTQGMGVTVIESHGRLVDRILDEVPESAADRVLVVRSGDRDNPVQVNPTAGVDRRQLEDIYLQILYGLFDPQREGIIGPRFETIYGDVMNALNALLPGRATPLAIPWVLQDRAAVDRLAKAIEWIDAGAAGQLRATIVGNTSNDLVEVLNWVNAKFHRLTNSEQLKAIMATGRNSVDVTAVLDERQVLLVDLDEPRLGRYPSRMLGEIWLGRHWEALSRRKDPSHPHLLIVDEAHTFQADLLPRFLAEAREFGVGVVLAHQNMTQLTEQLRGAVLSTTNSVAVFRSGPLDAAASVLRLGGWPGALLTRLPRLQAATSVSMGSRQTDAFTLTVDHNERVGSRVQPAHVRTGIEERSRRLLVDPHRDAPKITRQTVTQLVLEKAGPARPGSAGGPGGGDGVSGGTGGLGGSDRVVPSGPASNPEPASLRPTGGSFLDDWLAQRKKVADGVTKMEDEKP